MTPNDDALRLAAEVDEVAQTYPDMVEVSDCIRKLVAENEAQAALLRQITLTAHCGGLASMSEAEALIAIRKLTLAHWAVLHCLGETEIRQHLEGKA